MERDQDHAIYIVVWHRYQNNKWHRLLSCADWFRHMIEYMHTVYDMHKWTTLMHNEELIHSSNNGGNYAIETTCICTCAHKKWHPFFPRYTTHTCPLCINTRMAKPLGMEWKQHVQKLGKGSLSINGSVASQHGDIARRFDTKPWWCKESVRLYITELEKIGVTLFL